MLTGTIHKLCAERGFGFVLADPPAHGRYWFHARHVRGNRFFEDLRVGDQVKFEPDGVLNDSRGLTVAAVET